MTYTRFTVPTRNGDIKKPSYTKSNKGMNSNSSLYSAKYPEHTYVADDLQKPRDAETETTLDYVFSAGEPSQTEYIPERHRGSLRLVPTVCLVISVMVGSLIIYLSGIQAPDYVRNAFVYSYDALSTKYERLFYKIIQDEKAAAEGLFSDSHYISTQVVGQESSRDTEISNATVEGGFIASAAVAESKKNGSAEGTDTSTVSAYDDLDEITNTDANALIVSKNLSRGSDKVYALNETSLSLDTDALATAAYPIAAQNTASGEPLVLIVHTHGTECYSDSTADGSVRTTDKDKNVVRVGKELADILNSYGIPTLHSDTMHDEISYITSYQSSRKEITQMLELYPSVKYVIDLHRDAIPNDGNKRVKSYAEINGEASAQVMFVIGTNAGGGNHPYFADNLTVASHVQKRLNDVYPGLARPINVRNAIFNQNLSQGSLLLEVGSDANTLDEALTAVRLFARCFAETVIKGN